jgi:hypothetical protein
MGVTVCLPLFGNPGHELEEGAKLRGQQLRDLAAALQERLTQAADTLDKLEAAGWSARLAAFDVLLSLAGVETREEAERRLRALGVEHEHVAAALAERTAEEELSTAVALLERRFPVPPSEPRDCERALGVLLRRGYELELAHDALRRYARDPAS